MSKSETYVIRLTKEQKEELRRLNIALPTLMRTVIDGIIKSKECAVCGSKLKVAKNVK